MNYLSILFFAFLAVIFLLYYVLPKKAQWIVLLFGSIIFYGFASWAALPVLALETLAVFFLARKMERAEKKKGYVAGMIVLLVLALGLLMYVQENVL